MGIVLRRNIRARQFMMRSYHHGFGLTFQYVWNLPIHPTTTYGSARMYFNIRTFIKTMEDDWEGAAEIHKEIGRFENEADLKSCVHLPKGLFMPISRSDVLELVTRQI